MTDDNPILDLLAAPLRPDWTIDQLAEDVILAIVARGSGERQEFVIDAEAVTDRQSRRVLRPLLACLATKSAAETGTSTSLYGDRLRFVRPGRDGLMSVFCRFENTPERAWIAFHVVTPSVSMPGKAHVIRRSPDHPSGRLPEAMTPTTSEPGREDREVDPAPDRPGWAEVEAGPK